MGGPQSDLIVFAFSFALLLWIRERFGRPVWAVLAATLGCAAIAYADVYKGNPDFWGTFGYNFFSYLGAASAMILINEGLMRLWTGWRRYLVALVLSPVIWFLWMILDVVVICVFFQPCN